MKSATKSLQADVGKTPFFRQIFSKFWLLLFDEDKKKTRTLNQKSV
jgi:hypothetical protein